MTGSSVVEALREAALARAAILGLPTSALEDWRYVNLATLGKEPAEGEPHPIVTAADSADAAAIIDGFAADLGADPDQRLVAEEAGRLASEEEAPACWSWLGDTRHLRIDGHQTLAIAHHATTGASGWRLIIDIAGGAELDLTLVHRSHAATRASVGLVVRLGPGARLRLGETSAGAAGELFVHLDVRLERDARLEWTSASRGGTLLRHRSLIDLAGRGAEADIAAIDQIDGGDQAHRVVRVRHRVGPTTSRQVFKTVLAGRALASFDGLVTVDPGADGTDAQQLSRNLVLSPGARADARPQLDIHADEVKASHGATIGQLDADELLYLRMRGIPAAEATALLTTGFVAEITRRLPARALSAFGGAA
jgi:Fe-S cluster assembly protein SufD